MTRFAAYCDNGTLIATVGGDAAVRIWKADNGRELKSFPLAGGGGLDFPESVGFLPHCNELWVVKRNGYFEQWDVNSNQRTLKLNTNFRVVFFARMSPRGDSLLLGVADALLWSIPDRTVVRPKYKRLARGVTRAARALGRLAERAPESFVHWERGYAPQAR
jgi:hypothetical protein